MKRLDAADVIPAEEQQGPELIQERGVTGAHHSLLGSSLLQLDAVTLQPGPSS